VIGRSLAVVFAVSGVFGSTPQTTGRQNPPLVGRSIAGADLFQLYCSTCHGREGRGDGPLAAALKVPPPDLTLLAHRNRGVFVRERVQAFVANDGKELSPSHGTSDMPVWGPVFRGLDPSDSMTNIRIANIVEHLQSIQRK
jgi:mono/diheme cytochrome c family protein